MNRRERIEGFDSNRKDSPDSLPWSLIRAELRALWKIKDAAEDVFHPDDRGLIRGSDAVYGALDEYEENDGRR